MPGITVNTSSPNPSHKTPSIPMPITNGFSPSQLLISLSNPSSPHAQRLPLPHDSSPTKPQPLFHSGRSHLFKLQWLYLRENSLIFIIALQSPGRPSSSLPFEVSLLILSSHSLYITELCFKVKKPGDFPVVNTSPFNAVSVGSIPGQGAKISHASCPKIKSNIK